MAHFCFKFKFETKMVYFCFRIQIQKKKWRHLKSIKIPPVLPPPMLLFWKYFNFIFWIMRWGGGGKPPLHPHHALISVHQKKKIKSQHVWVHVKLNTFRHNKNKNQVTTCMIPLKTELKNQVTTYMIPWKIKHFSTD